MTFTAEKKDGNQYKHSSAKVYLNTMLRLVREECEAVLTGSQQTAAKEFFESAQKGPWFTNIQSKMERHFARRAAQEGESMVKKAPPVALKQLIAGNEVRACTPFLPATPEKR